MHVHQMEVHRWNGESEQTQESEKRCHAIKFNYKYEQQHLMSRERKPHSMSRESKPISFNFQHTTFFYEWSTKNLDNIILKTASGVNAKEYSLRVIIVYIRLSILGN